MIFFIGKLAYLFGLYTFLTRRILSYLRYYQQEQYIDSEFFHWLVKNKTFDKRGTLLLLILSLLSLPLMAFYLLGALLFFLLSKFEVDPRQEGKIRLVMTERAQRIERVTLILVGLALLRILFARGALFTAVTSGIAIQLLPFLLVVANRILRRKEKKIQQSFYNDAHQRFMQIRPYTVAITGSFGKTSTKHMVAELLNATAGATFFPAGGINSLMGVTREVREKLRPMHRYAVIEMGAFVIGSIRRLCELTPPDAAIITAVASMHLHRFGGQDRVYEAKSELPQAVPAAGELICNGDNPGARKMAQQFAKKKTWLYGLEREKGALDFYASNLSITAEGTQFTLEHEGQSYPAFIPLWGKAQVSNALAAVAFVVARGVSMEKAIAALTRLEGVDNRLQLQKVQEVTYLKDAYNSNPVGFLTALEVLRALPGKRKMLMTPGMIELGEIQFEENKRVAKAACNFCDVILFVGDTNRRAFELAFEESKLEAVSKMVWVRTREEAFKYFEKEKKAGDVLLIENDLPDLFNQGLAWKF